MELEICSRAQAVLEAQWNADYAAAEAAWPIERDQARAEHRKPPKPVKPPKPRAVYSVVSVEGVEGVECVRTVEGVNSAEVAEVAEDAEDEDAEELADIVRELEITDFRNVSAGKQLLLTFHYGYILYTNINIDGKLRSSH